MAALARLRVTWTGTPVVGTGLSTFYSQGTFAAGDAGDIKAFFTAVKATFPSGITWTIPNSYDIIEDTSGVLLGGGTTTGGGTETSGGTGTNFVQGAGGRVVWNTNGIFKGRRVRGSTFMVPLVADYWEGANAISSVATGNWSTAAAALIAAVPTLSIWSRPSGGVAGEQNLVTSATIPDKTSWIRSRRV
jgi:hypothetical protein